MELYGEEVERVIAKSPFRDVESMEVLHFLRFDASEIAAICRVHFRGGESNLLKLHEEGGPTELRILERHDRDGSFVIFIRGRPRPDPSPLNLIREGSGYMFTPFEIRHGRSKICFLGNMKQIKQFRGYLEERGLRYRVLSMSDAKFSISSPLSVLTEKQRKILVTAFELGYYDVPRKLNTDELASRLGLGNSTVVEHIRKAERRLLVEMLGKY